MIPLDRQVGLLQALVLRLARAERPYLKQESLAARGGGSYLSRQFIATSAEVTPKGGDCNTMALIPGQDLLDTMTYPYHCNSYTWNHRISEIVEFEMFHTRCPWHFARCCVFTIFWYVSTLIRFPTKMVVASSKLTIDLCQEFFPSWWGCSGRWTANSVCTLNRCFECYEWLLWMISLKDQDVIEHEKQCCCPCSYHRSVVVVASYHDMYVVYLH